MLEKLLGRVLDFILARIWAVLSKWKYWEPRWAKPLIPVLAILTLLGAYLSLWPSGDELNHTLFPWVTTVKPTPTPVPRPIVWFSELEPSPVSQTEFRVEVKAREIQPNAKMWLLYECIQPRRMEYEDKAFVHQINYDKKEGDISYWHVNFRVLDPPGLGPRITLAAIIVDDTRDQEYSIYIEKVKTWKSGGGMPPAPVLDRKPGEEEVIARAEIDLTINAN